MAPRKKSNNINMQVLAAIAEAMGADRSGYMFLGPQDRAPLVEAGLIQVNESLTEEGNANNFAVRLTDSGFDYISKQSQTKPDNKANTESGVKMDFQITSGAVLPEPKRGKPSGAGGTSKYPFAQLQPGQGFFVADGDKPATKTLGALVSNFNMKGAVQTGETKTVKVGRRDPNDKTKFIIGPDGKKVYDEVTKPVLKPQHKLVVRSVEPGQKYGDVGPFPSKGAYVLRVE